MLDRLGHSNHGYTPLQRREASSLQTMPRFHCPTALIPGQLLILPDGAARHVQVGDLIIVAAFAGMSQEEAASFKPNLIYVDGSNRITHTNHSIPTQAA